MIGGSLFGDWEKARETVASMGERLEAATKRAMLKEAQFMRAKIVEGMREQAPGGKAYRPLSPLTIAVRQFARFKGTKALIRRADLRNSVVVKATEEGAFVGVLRTARGKGGQNLVNVAEENEFGAGPIVVPITPKSHAFFMAALRHAGIELPESKSGGGYGGGLAIAIVRIPPRPTFGPVWAKWGQPEQVRERFYANLVADLRELGGE